MKSKLELLRLLGNMRYDEPLIKTKFIDIDGRQTRVYYIDYFADDWEAYYNED